ncbi:MAG: H4MPT-linked C1 transfer pathway protein [Anaerolineae bacterium]|nr:H4MPT-linked C1 transfer pathway protein [Anaerolineales bacterium]MCQ3972733.1 H4MPT-linked C1 transfer pathway protein [Anaerolineae bacterium]
MTREASNHYGSSNSAVTGWDIGGANLKAVRLSREGLQVVQQPFAVWQRRDELAEALARIAAELGPAPRAAVTITAELSDAFRTKRDGITFVLDALQAALSETELKIFGLDGKFHHPAKAYQQPMLVAAANWLATALLVARDLADCLLVDIGSTTTDITPIGGGKVLAEGRNDPERLVRGELLYTGVSRTPICALAPRVPLWGGWCPVAAELFATTQDVHLLLGHLPAEQCTSPSADGRPATPEYALERLARVVCADTELLSQAEVQAIAQYIANEQIHQIAGAMTQVLSRVKVVGPVAAVGAGAFLAEAAAARLGLDYLRPATLASGAVSIAAPAAAVALLLNEEACV